MCCCSHFTKIPGEISSEFEQNARDGTRNLTDFSARVTWTATSLRNEVRGVGSYVQGISYEGLAMPDFSGFSPEPTCHSENAEGCSKIARSTNQQRTGHAKINSGDKPYRCDHSGCGKSFARNEELTRHKNIHTGLKAYVCKTCNKAFGRKDHLSKHEKTHLKASEKKMHRCYIVGCNHEYTRSDALARHLSTAHSSSTKR